MNQITERGGARRLAGQSRGSAAAPWLGVRRSERKLTTVHQTLIQKHGRREELTANPNMSRARARAVRRRWSTWNSSGEAPVHIQWWLESEPKREEREQEAWRLRGTETKFGKEITGEESRPNGFSTMAAILAACGASQARQRRGEAEWARRAARVRHGGGREGGGECGSGGESLRFC